MMEWTSDRRPLDDYVVEGDECNCKATPYDQFYPDPDWMPVHYRRRCEGCGNTWFSTHCPHDGYQNKCSACGTRAPQRYES